MAYETAYVDLRDDLDTRVITDMHDLAVAEKGKPPGLATRMECALILAFARLKVRQKVGLRHDQIPEQEKLNDKYGLVPKSLASWIGVDLQWRQPDLVAVRRLLFQERQLRGNETIWDLWP